MCLILNLAYETFNTELNHRLLKLVKTNTIRQGEHAASQSIIQLCHLKLLKLTQRTDKVIFHWCLINCLSLAKQFPDLVYLWVLPRQSSY
jgi:hypothetical protein